VGQLKRQLKKDKREGNRHSGKPPLPTANTYAVGGVSSSQRYLDFLAACMLVRKKR
jgi:hypothetical protein